MPSWQLGSANRMTPRRRQPDASPVLRIKMEEAKVNGYGSLDLLATVGLLFLGKFLLYLVWEVVVGLRAHVWSKLWQKHFVETYGKWAVVTGCTSGIGEQYALQLAKEGMNIVLVARSLEKLQKLAALIGEKYGVQTDIVQVDFTEGRIIYDKIEHCLQDKEIGVLVNNVGIAHPLPIKFENFSFKDIWQLVDVNVGSVPAMTTLVLPGMLARGRGAIINISSMTAFLPLPRVGLYSASKAFVDYFSQTLEWECRGSGVTVQTVKPAFVVTNMTKMSKRIGEPSFKTPTASKFVRNALATLGYSHLTSGYWVHGITTYLKNNVFSKWLCMYFYDKKFALVEEDIKRNL